MGFEMLRRYAENNNIIEKEDIEKESTGKEEAIKKSILLKNEITKKIEERKNPMEIIDDCIECICLLSKDTSYYKEIKEAKAKANQNELF